MKLLYRWNSITYLEIKPQNSPKWKHILKFPHSPYKEKHQKFSTDRIKHQTLQKCTFWQYFGHLDCWLYPRSHFSATDNKLRLHTSAACSLTFFITFLIRTHLRLLHMWYLFSTGPYPPSVASTVYSQPKQEINTFSQLS